MCVVWVGEVLGGCGVAWLGEVLNVCGVAS